MNKSIEITSAILVVIMTGAGICCGVLNARSPDEGALRSMLAKDSTYYQQTQQPTTQQEKAGTEALLKWHDAAYPEHGRLATQLVLGGTLNGLAEEDVIRYLGKPDERSAQCLKYNVTADEDYCYLCVDIADKKVKKSFLDVAYIRWW
ncbi:hypothetical protein KF728_29540 [Candidatus Obscuribacterales bacterium]|nr:hypothetical protein [Candidatus Obscuribacterales bacterium]MBX3154332.1 hypothetical protein [Candidatus Obscuribacterales bacterium]